MNKPTIAISLLGLLLSLSATVPTSDAATVFGGSRVEGVDQAQRTITFKTKEGQTWTLQVADPKVFDHQPIAKGDQVTIEIDLDDRITKVLKLSEVSPAPRGQMEDR